MTGFTTFVESSKPPNQTSKIAYSTSLFSNNKTEIKKHFSKKENFNSFNKAFSAPCIIFNISTNSFSVISQISVKNLSFKSSKCGLVKTHTFFQAFFKMEKTILQVLHFQLVPVIWITFIFLSGLFKISIAFLTFSSE
jgi:hypothetical protein